MHAFCSGVSVDACATHRGAGDKNGENGGRWSRSVGKSKGACCEKPSLSNLTWALRISIHLSTILPRPSHLHEPLYHTTARVNDIRTYPKCTTSLTTNMRSATSLLFLLTLVNAHGNHSFDLSDEDIGMSYAERHVCSPPFLSLFSTKG
jgi:hypothetical protein